MNREREVTTVLAGVAWTGGLRFLAQTTSWASTLILARILTPSDYGVVSMAATWAFFIGIFVEAGVGATIVSRGVRDPSLLKRLNSLALVLGVAGSLVALATAPLAARFYGQHELYRVLLALGALPLIEGSRVVPLSVLLRDKRYRENATNELVRNLTQTAVVLVAALVGLGYWALIIGIIVGETTSSALAIYRVPVGYMTPVGRRVLVSLRTSVHLCASRLSWYLYANSSFAIGGRMAGARALGFYSLAWNISSLPGEKLGNVVLGVTGPVFGQLRQDAVAGSKWLLAFTEGLSLVVVVPLVGLVAVADLVVPLVLGSKWIPAITPLRWLVVYHALHTPTMVLNQALAARGDPRLSSRIAWISTLLLIPAFVIGARLNGVNGIAAAWAIGYPALALLRVAYVVPLFGLSWGQYLRAWVPACRTSVIMGLAVLAVRGLAGLLHLPRIPELLLAVSVGTVVVCGIILRTQSPVVQGLRSRLTGRLRGRRASQVEAAAPRA